MNFLSFCSVNELFLMTFLAWKPGHMITFSCVLIFFFFFLFWFVCLYVDYTLTWLTIDITGRENGSDVDSGIIILFREHRTSPSLT